MSTYRGTLQRAVPGLNFQLDGKPGKFANWHFLFEEACRACIDELRKAAV